MTDNPENNGNTGGENQRIGRELYQQDKAQQRSGDHNQQWDAGNHFHTGPSSQGAQDGPAQNYGSDYAHNRNTVYNQGKNAHLNDHYGSRPDSPYNQERSWINHGDRPDNNYNQQGGYVRDGSRPGNYSDQNDYRNDLWREGPGSRSRYKEDDYRYGSGSHNWYREGRYSPDNAGPQQDQRGFFQRVKDGWNDIMQSDNPDYTPRSQGGEHDRFDRERRGSEVFRDRNFNRGYESGPRWADESDSGNDNDYRNPDRTPRNRW